MPTLDETIKRLQDLREVVGGSVQVCRKSEETKSVMVFIPACFEVSNVVDASTADDNKEYVCCRNGNTSKIVTVF